MSSLSPLRQQQQPLEKDVNFGLKLGGIGRRQRAGRSQQPSLAQSLLVSMQTTGPGLGPAGPSPAPVPNVPMGICSRGRRRTRWDAFESGANFSPTVTYVS